MPSAPLPTSKAPLCPATKAAPTSHRASKQCITTNNDHGPRAAPPPPPKDTRADEPDSFGKGRTPLGEGAELRRRVEKGAKKPRTSSSAKRKLVLKGSRRQKRHVIQQQEVHGSERLVDADLLYNHHELFKRSGHQFNLGEKYERARRDTQRALSD